MGEQVISVHALRVVSVGGKSCEVAGERNRVAGDVDHGCRSKRGKIVDHPAASASARRVEHDGASAQPITLERTRGCRQPTQPAVDSIGLHPRAHPLGKVLTRVLGCTLIGFDRGQARRGTSALTQHGTEETDSAIQIQVPSVRVHTAVGKQVGDSLRQGRRCQPMHLPEAGGIHSERALPDSFGDDLGPGGAGSPVGHREHAHMPVGGLHQVDAAGAAGPQLQGCPFDRGGGKRQRRDRDDSVTAGGIGTDRSRVIDMQGHARAPAGAVGALADDVIADRRRTRRRHRALDTEPTRALQRSAQDAVLELALMIQLDVPEVGSPGSITWSPVHGCLGPDVLLTVRGCIQHLEHLAAPEGGLGGLGQADPDALPRDRIGDEDDPPLVSTDEHPAVRGIRDRQVDDLARCRTHPSSIAHATSVDRMDVLLASTSPARRMLLRQAGIEPRTLAPRVDEDAVIAETEATEGRVLPPDEHVLLLARRKAADVVSRLRQEEADFRGIVIGGDSMFELDGHVLGKPHHAEVAIERWRQMRGRTGILHSGHSVFLVQPGHPAREEYAVARASVSFADDVTDDEIAAYVATGEPLAVAGAFTVDSLGGPFIRRVEGDPSTVVGMSLSTVRDLTRRLGVAWPTLWNRPTQGS